MNQSTGQLIWNVKTASVPGFIGIICWVINRLLGVGGGFVIVPALRKVTDLDMEYVATSLMIILIGGGYFDSHH